MTFGSFYTIFITSTDSFLNDSIQTSHSHSKRSQIQFFWVWVVCPERSFFLGSVSFSSLYVLCLPDKVRLRVRVRVRDRVRVTSLARANSIIEYSQASLPSASR